MMTGETRTPMDPFGLVGRVKPEEDCSGVVSKELWETNLLTCLPIMAMQAIPGALVLIVESQLNHN
jgi:hypothetical protein